MQQLKIEHQKIMTTDQKVENTKTKKDRRPGKGRAVALARHIYQLQNSDVYYVESETSDDHYYFVKFKPDGFESSWWCSCKDYSTRHLKCKHLFAIEFAIKWGTLRDTADKLPTNVKRDIIQSVALQSKSYKDDDYSF